MSKHTPQHTTIGSTPVIDHSWSIVRIALSAGRRITLFTLTCYGGVGVIRRAAASFSKRSDVGGEKSGGPTGGRGGG